jgi:hypothetical protein
MHETHSSNTRLQTQEVCAQWPGMTRVTLAANEPDRQPGGYGIGGQGDRPPAQLHQQLAAAANGGGHGPGDNGRNDAGAQQLMQGGQGQQQQQAPPQQQQAPQGPPDAAVAAVAAQAQAVAAQAQAAGIFAAVPPLNFHVHVPPPQPPQRMGMNINVQRGNRRNESGNEYCALFVALIGEGPDPQGVINTSDGKVVRAFHRFTLVDQKSGRDITKGRQRQDGAVKISCARQDPNARNCHGYRKFVRKAVLEDPVRGFLLDDRIVIRYTIELVVSQVCSRHPAAPCPASALICSPSWESYIALVWKILL